MNRPTFPLPALLPVGVVVAVVASWSPFLIDGLRADDFPGHVALLRVMSDILAADASLPLWNGREYAGTSLVIAYLHPLGSLAFLSPFSLLFGADLGLRVGGIFYLSVAAISMYAWCAAWGRSKSGAALGALVYVLHPSVFGFVGAAGQMHQPVTLAVLPLVFLAWQRLAVAPGVRRVVAAAVISALLLLDMQRFFIAMPFVMIVFLATCLSETQTAAMPRRMAVGLLAAAATFALVLLLLCFPALPVLEERSLLQWHSPDALEAWRQRFSLAHLLQFVDRAGVFAPVLSALPAAKTAAPPGQWYQGSVAIAFVLVGGWLTARGPVDASRRDRLAVTLGCGSLVVALAFGPRSLFGSQLELAGQLLGAGSSGLAALAALVLVLALWVAGLWWGVASLGNRWPGRRWLVVLLGVGAVALLGFVAPFDPLSRLIFVYDHIRGPAHFAFPMLGFVIGSAMCLVAPAWERWAGAQSRVVGGVVLVASLHAVDVFPYVSKLVPDAPVAARRQLEEAFRGLRERPPGRMLDVSGYSPLADALGATEAERPSAWGWLAWTSTRHTSELVLAGVARQIGQRDFDQAAEIAGLANVRFLSHLAASGGRLEASDALAMVVRNRQVVIAANRRVLPYAQFYPQLAWVSGANPGRLPTVAVLARAGIASYTLDPVGIDPLPEGTPDFVAGVEARNRAPGVRRIPATLPRRPEGVEAPCEIERPRDTLVRASCEIDAPGFLVIAESWSPRWSVEVDGVRRPLLRLNHAFQGVALAPGDRQVRFGYRASTATRVGVLVSSVSWLSVAGFGLITWVRRRR